ncbi:M23 family metallopeptidase [Rhodoplanes roseus]|uniref:M23 family metallopeptidase n=1 Tax=Rhodoplanes roseus TaxID=29409 RepID=UPI001FDF76E1|nr:M23 family metallopeptidase [Rhodoplanes roseus]
MQNFVDHDKGPDVRDYACGRRAYDGHDGTDIRVRTRREMEAGVDVVAAAKGRVVRTRDGMADTVGRPKENELQGRECGNGVALDHGAGWETQYCHLARGSVAVKSGDQVEPGARLGRIGMSGRTEFPHLHFTVRFRGKAVDPFAFGAAEGACSGGQALWRPGLEEDVAYRPGVVLDAGFSSAPVTLQAVEAGSIADAPLRPVSPVLVAYVRAIGLRAGDVQRITVLGPDGEILVDNTAEALDRDKAQSLLFAGRRRTVEPWREGAYTATYTVQRDGRIAVEHRFDTRLAP